MFLVNDPSIYYEIEKKNTSLFVYFLFVGWEKYKWKIQDDQQANERKTRKSMREKRLKHYVDLFRNR